jgi:hypothetical protein
MPAASAAQPQAPKYGGWQTHGFGRVLSTVLGGDKVAYQEDPNNPNGPKVPIAVPMKPGEMFRHILGAGILGLAAGAGTKDFGQGFQRGVGAQKQQQEQDDEKARQQNQQDYENTLRQKDEARKDTELGFKQREEDRNAKVFDQTVALNNFRLRQAVVDLSGKSMELHKQGVEADAPIVRAYQQAGVNPVGEAMTETQLKDIEAKDPTAPTKRWLATGMTKSIDKDGNVQYEQLFTPYPANAKLTLTGKSYSDFVARAKKSGFANDNQGIFDLISKQGPEKGYTFTPEQMDSLVYGPSGIVAHEAKQLDTREKEAKIGEYTAQAAHAKAEIARVGLEMRKTKMELFSMEEGKNAEKALVTLQNAGWDMSKMSDKQREAIQRVAPAMQAKYFEQYSKLKAEAGKEQDPTEKQKLNAEADDLVSPYHFWKGLTSPGAPASPSGASANHFQTSDGIYKLPEKKVDGFRKQFTDAIPRPDLDRAESAGLTVDDKGKVVPPKVVDGYNTAIGKIKSFDPKAASRIESYLKFVVGYDSRSGNMRPLDENSAKTAQKVIDSEIASMNDRMQASAEANRVNR